MTPEAGDRAYFEKIEEEFIRLRGAPLLLSPADWRLADRWQREGVPLHVVLAGIREVFRRRAEREAKAPEAAQKRVSSLRYCRSAVETAWSEQKELGDGAAVRPKRAAIDVTERLASLANSVPAALPDPDSWRRRILALGGAAAEVEERLIELDLELTQGAFDALPAEDREAVLAEAEVILERTAGRVDEDRRTDLRQRLVRRLVRARCGLPLLSLFADPAGPSSRG